MARKEPAKEPKKATPKPLTEKQELFCVEYLIDLNAKAAYLRANPGVTEATAKANGSRLLTRADVQERVGQLMAERTKQTRTDATMVVEQWRAIAEADPNELVEFRRTCCRHCYGVGFRYQRTPAEREKDIALWAKMNEKKDPLPLFDEQGGVGYNPTKAPNKDCPECFGEGEGRAFFKDTRALSIPARMLYGGVQVSKDGIKVMLNSKEKALEMLARHNGMLVDRSEVSGPDGGPVQQQHTVTPLDPMEAYRLMKGGDG